MQKVGEQIAFEVTPALLSEARKLAEKQGIALDKFVYLALEEKISAAHEDAFFEERAKRGNLTRALALLDRAGTDEIIPGDER